MGTAIVRESVAIRAVAVGRVLLGGMVLSVVSPPGTVLDPYEGPGGVSRQCLIRCLARR